MVAEVGGVVGEEVDDCSEFLIPLVTSSSFSASVFFFSRDDFPVALVFPFRVDSNPYFCAASSIYPCSFSLKNPLHSVPPCPSKTPK